MGMRRQWQTATPLLLVLGAALLGGCVTSDEAQLLLLPTLHDMEMATYTAKGFDGPVLEVSYQLVGSEARVEWKTLPPLSPQAGFGVVDVETGERLYAEARGTQTFFWGPGRVIPHDPFTALVGFEGELNLLDDLAVLLGPQWAFWEPRADSWPYEISTDSSSNNWTIEIAVDCWASCPSNQGAIPLRQVWVGDHGMLPARFHYHAEGSAGLYLERVSHTLGEMADVTVHPWPEAPSTQAARLCSGWPCAGPNWPERLAPATVQRVIESDPAWILWRQEYPDVLPSLMVASTGSLARLGVTPVGEQAGGGINYPIVGAHIEQFGALWVVSDQGDLEEVPSRARGQASWFDSMEAPAPLAAAITMSEALEIARSQGIEGDVSAFTFLLRGSLSNPDPRGQPVLFMRFGDFDNSTVATMSMHDGTLMALSG